MFFFKSALNKNFIFFYTKSIKGVNMYEKEKCTLKFTYGAAKWIKEHAGTLDEYEVNLIKTMLMLDKKKITKGRIESVYFTATHTEEIEQVIYQTR